MESPVVRIFDVVRSVNSASYDLLVLPQPSVRSPKDEESGLLDSTFVGCTDNGGWYALSEANFPYVTRQASNAGCYSQGTVWKTLPAPEREKSLVGIHKVHYTSPNEPYPAVPALPASSYEGAKEPTDAPPSPQPSAAPPSPPTSTGPWLATLAVFLAANAVFLFVSPMMKTKPGEVISDWLSFDHRRILFHPPVLSDSLITERIEPFPSDAPASPIADVQPVTELPESNIEGSQEPKPEEIQAEPDNAPVEEVVKSNSEGQTFEEIKEVVAAVVGEEDEAAKTPIVRFKEPEPAEVPVTENGATDGNTDGNVGGETAEPPVTPKKKGYKRGRRGGKKKSANSNQPTQTSHDGEMALTTVVPSVASPPAETLDQKTIPGTDRVGRVTVLSTGNVEPDGPSGGYHVLNNLEIWEEEILGRYPSSLATSRANNSQVLEVRGQLCTGDDGRARLLQ
jgi:serine/threonine-protein kinase/endoribonuclease IRE1